MTTPIAPVGGRTKRAFDLAITVPTLVVLSPILVGLALWIRRDSPGPALFRQTRIGYAGKPFRVFKFRSMIVDAESQGAGLRVTSGDDRITASGRVLRRLSLDELPQLINVALGDMSLVGPRPTVPAQVERYSEHQRRRLLARPGLTGLAQVRGRNAIPWSQRIEIDVEYVDRWSLRRDLGILARTVMVVLGRGQTYDDQAPVFDLPAKDTDD